VYIIIYYSVTVVAVRSRDRVKVISFVFLIRVSYAYDSNATSGDRHRIFA